MLQRKRLPAFLTAVLLLCALSLTAYAHPVVDLSQKGSIRVAMRYGEQAVPGGTMTLYRVAAVQEDDGNFGFVLTGDFADCGIELADLQSAELAKALADYAAGAKLEGQTKQIAEDGTVLFAELEPGLYLLVQTQPAAGYYAANPFLVSVPMLEEGEYVYDVQAGPKAELSPISTPAPTPTPTPAPGIPFIPIIPILPFWPTPTPVIPQEPTVPVISVNVETEAPVEPGAAGPAVPILPQTGQLNWPVPVLAAAGLGLFAAGWALRYGKKDDEE